MKREVERIVESILRNFFDITNFQDIGFFDDAGKQP